MSHKSDIEIARAASKRPIQEIGAKLGIGSDDLLPYGHDKAKVSQDFINSVQGNATGKLVLVTAINPTTSTSARAICSETPPSGMSRSTQRINSHPFSAIRSGTRPCLPKPGDVVRTTVIRSARIS